ncbi:MAG: type II toxin-antitoxin system VapC family toxin [Deltaproteobacteria bacterium]|nr:type II toxin-antitoxin system VapC family toxin [Deltaproteobacteria bacterium]
MTTVFVDSGGFVALLVAEDACHERAQALWSQADQEGWTFVTTNTVVVETYSVLLARSREKRRAALSFLDMLSTDGYRIERVRPADETKAISLLKAHEDKTYSLCDALSFTVMDRLKIRRVIAFDRHFREYGRFEVLSA